MIVRSAVFALAVLGTQGFFARVPAAAASQATSAFLANLTANTDFLDQSSRLAQQRTKVAGIKTYARGQAQEAARIASALGGIAPAVETADAGLATGRSVAIDGDTTTAGAMPAAGDGAPLSKGDLDRLATLDGRQFDDIYWQTQLVALSQVENDYRDYIAHGDDPALIAIAKRELPKVMHRLEMLTKI